LRNNKSLASGFLPFWNPTMLEIFNVGTTWVNPSFLNLIDKVLNRNIATVLDKRKIPFGDMSSLVSVFGELKKEGSDAFEIQKNPGSVLQHVHASFLLIALKDQFVQVISESSLQFLIADNPIGKPYETALVSGTLEQWRTDIINGCSANADFAFTTFCNKVVLSLEKAGLVRLFDLYSKVSQKDGTFQLTLKE
jgi:hypothetical protein